jgi:hypothetical protein
MRNSHTRIWGQLILPIALMTYAFSSAWSQALVVQIIDGRNGKPITKARVYIGFDDLRSRQVLDPTTDRQGIIQFETNGAKTFQVHPIGDVACGEQPVGSPSRDYSIDRVLKEGILTQNECGHSNAEAQRGRLVYFVRPATNSELFKN